MCKLRELRIKKGLRRDFVADKLGIVPDHLNRLERGATPLNLLQINKLAEIYNCSLGEITKIALETVGGKTMIEENEKILNELDKLILKKSK